MAAHTYTAVHMWESFYVRAFAPEYEKKLFSWPIASLNIA